MGRFFFPRRGLLRGGVQGVVQHGGFHGVERGAAAAVSSAPASSRSSAHRRVNACDGVPMVTDAGVTNAAADEAVSERRSAL